MTDDVEPLFICLVAVAYHFWSKTSVQILCPILNRGSLSFLLMSCKCYISALSCVRQCIWRLCRSLPLCGLFSCHQLRAWAFVVGASLAVQSMGSLSFSSCSAWLSRCVSWAPEHRRSGHGAWVRCTVACGGFPDLGWNLCLLHWPVDSLPLGH